MVSVPVVLELAASLEEAVVGVVAAGLKASVMAM